VICHICKDEKTLIVGWSQHPIWPNAKVRWEHDPCPECTPGPHSFHAKRKAAEIAAMHLRSLVAQETIEKRK
jgi:hypothetical protein